MNSLKNNKLGIYNDKELSNIEYILFNNKYHLINEAYTFNCKSIFSTDYLEKLHIFLFNDIYDLEYCKIRNSDSLITEANKLLQEIKEMLIFNDTNNLPNKIFELWEYQLFLDGNTKTILCFLKILSKNYDLNITYNFNNDVKEDYFINKVIDSIKIKKYV